jgi:hypothetical protein
MIKYFTIIAAFFLISLFYSCKKENDKALLLLSPIDLYIPAESDEVVVIGISCTSPSELTELIIKARIEGSYSKQVLDTALSGRKFNMQFEYLVPNVDEKSNIILEFELHDTNDDQVSNFKVLEVTPHSVILTETAGNEIYSEYSGKQNGFNIITGAPVFLNLADSSEVHFADTTNTDILLNRWISPAGVMFVKFDGLDYANCTNLTARSAYNAGLKQEMLNNISEGDIYITKIRNKDLAEIYPVIKITGIIDEPGSQFDRYVFNIKK